MKKAEIILATLSIIALGLNLLLIPGSGVLTVLTLSTLSVIYFFGFALFNDIRFKKMFIMDSYKDISSLRIFGALGAGLSLSMTIVGLLFKFQSWPGASMNLGVGLVGLLIVTIIGLTKHLKNKSEYYIRIFKRAALFGGLGLILMLIPKTTWVELKYRNHPKFIEALKHAMANPDNQELWDKVDEERQKMDNNKHE